MTNSALLISTCNAMLLISISKETSFVQRMFTYRYGCQELGRVDKRYEALGPSRDIKKFGLDRSAITAFLPAIRKFYLCTLLKLLVQSVNIGPKNK